VSVTLTALQTSIAGLSIAGITRIFTSIDAPVSLNQRDLPVLMPDPTKPMESSVSQRLTIGTLAGRSGWQRQRVLNYVCLVAELGTGRKPGDWAERLANCIDAVEGALCDFAADGVHTVGPVVIGDVGIVQDAVSAGVNAQVQRQFLGFTVQLTVLTSY